MKEVTINRCDFCTKTSFNKASIKVHEKKCFHNPATQSCATCLWFSRIHLGGPPSICFMGVKYAYVNEFKPTLNTKCSKWISAELVEDINLYANERGVLCHLLSGDMEVLNIIEGIKATGTSYYDYKLDRGIE